LSLLPLTKTPFTSAPKNPFGRFDLESS